jgi:hypothetical protein
MNMVIYQMPMKSFRNGGLHLQDIQEDKLKWNDITPSEYTEIDQNIETT